MTSKSMKQKILKMLPKFILFLSVLSLFPLIVSAAGQCDNLTGLRKVICQIHQILDAIIPTLVALGVVYFVWGIVQYFIADSEEAKKKGKSTLIYGIVGLVVIVGLWGIVDIVVKTFDIGGAAPSLVPLTGTSATCDIANNPKFQDLLCYITRIINDAIIPLIFTLAVVMFIWGVVQYFLGSDEEGKRTKGKQFMIWGILALTVMLTVWGLVKIVGSTFGLKTSVLPQVRPN